MKIDIEKAIEWQKGFKGGYLGITDEVYDFTINALMELKQYRKIGTLDECRIAREKMIPKKPLKRLVGGERLKREFSSCPNCNEEMCDVAYLNGKADHFKGKKTKYCSNCGQALKWG